MGMQSLYLLQHLLGPQHCHSAGSLLFNGGHTCVCLGDVTRNACFATHSLYDDQRYAVLDFVPLISLLPIAIFKIKDFKEL